MTELDVLVIGSGPAGLTAASYAARAGLKTAAYDALAPGGQLLLIDEIENYPGVSKIKGYTLAEEMEKSATEFGVAIEYSAITGLRKEEDGFIATTEEGDVKAKSVVIATGATHRHLGVKGEEEYAGRGVSYCATCDGPFFKGRRIVVVGGGDTALTDALYLNKLSDDVTLVHRRNEFRAQKVLVDRVEKSNIKLKLSRNISEICSEDGRKVTHVILDDGEKLECDAVFIFVGIKPNSEIFKDFVELDRSGFIITDDAMRTSVEGVFAAGDVRTTHFRQVSTAVGDGAMAAHMADEYVANLTKN